MLRLYGKLTIFMKAMYGILVIGKQVNKLLGGAAEKKQNRQQYGRNNMNLTRIQYLLAMLQI